MVATSITLSELHRLAREAVDDDLGVMRSVQMDAAAIPYDVRIRHRLESLRRHYLDNGFRIIDDTAAGDL